MPPRSFTFDVDAESAALSVSWDIAGRQSVMSHQAYGPLTGLPRILSILERHGVRSTFFVPGWTAERHPGVIRDIVAAGHEIAHHGYLHESPIGRSVRRAGGLPGPRPRRARPDRRGPAGRVPRAALGTHL